MSKIDMQPFSESVAEWLAVVLGAIVLCFPIVFNGSAYLFPDSDSYYRGGSTIMSFLTHKKTNEAVKAEAAPTPSDGNASEDAHVNIDTTVFLARSPFYGVLVYLVSKPKGFWSLVAIQALVASFALFQSAKAFSGRRPLAAFAATVFITAVASSLPWYVSFVMPDIWLGAAIVCWIAVIFGTGPQRLFSLLAACVLIIAAALFHQSNWVVLVGIAVSAPLVGLITGVADRRMYTAVAVGVIGIGAGLAANWTFGYLAQRHYGEPIRQPIFVTARLLADGPGREYLQKSCAENPQEYVLCRYRNQPLESSDDILWSSEAGSGVYTTADYETRKALSEEQWRFVMGVLANDGLGVMEAAAANTLEQLSTFSLREFEINYWLNWSKSEYWSNLKIFDAMPASSRCIRAPDACKSPKWISFSDDLQQWVFLASLLFVGAVVSSQFLSWRVASDLDRRLTAVAILLLLVVLGNAFICGAVSGPVDRYEARLSWMLPAFAALVLAMEATRRQTGEASVFSGMRSFLIRKPRSESVR